MLLEKDPEDCRVPEEWMPNGEQVAAKKIVTRRRSAFRALVQDFGPIWYGCSTFLSLCLSFSLAIFGLVSGGMVCRGTFLAHGSDTVGMTGLHGA